MSTVFVLIVVLGLLGAATFLIGFSKGVREAVREYRNPQPEGAWSDPFAPTAVMRPFWTTNAPLSMAGLLSPIISRAPS